jgi:DNA-binding CsgD family transcriptional regulator
MTTTWQLTVREKEVLQLLARGCTYAQVGDHLGISAHTVESHVKNLYRKLNVHSARTAVWRATELRLLSHGSDLGLAPEGQRFPVYRQLVTRF